jgi:hypothetical protein
MAKYIKQGGSNGGHISGGSFGGDKSRNGTVINSSKTQSESMMRGGSSSK